MNNSNPDAFSRRWGSIIESQGYQRLYDQLAPTYDAGHQWIIDQFGARLGEHLNRLELGIGPRVLDVGCGTGLSTESIRRASNTVSVTGLDLNAAMLQASSYDTVKVRADCQQLPFVDASFDTVTCCLSLSNVNDVGQALREFQRVLSPNGSLTIMESPRDPKTAAVAASLSELFAEDAITTELVTFYKEGLPEGQNDFTMSLTTIRMGC